ncbi:MAG: hypothetical protein WCL06_10230 [Bacteroidota bacterium]
MKKVSNTLTLIIAVSFIIFSVGCDKGPKNVPTVTTTIATHITQTTATSGGNVTNDQGEYVTARGVCWGTSPHPTISNHITMDGQNMWEFTSKLTGLTANTKYYYRAYAIIRDNPTAGTGYGAEYSFTTLP